MKLRFNRSALMFLAASLTLGSAVAFAEKADPKVATLKVLAEDSRRAEANLTRNQYRHPAETLAFFGIQPDMTVVELWPGRGWYTEILAPYLKQEGQFVAAGFQVEGIDESNRRLAYRARIGKEYREAIETNKAWWGPVTETILAPPTHLDIAPEGSADMVLTFRNLHNWEMNGEMEMVFAAVHKALKPGGVFGVVEHRSAVTDDDKARAKSGYVSQERTIEAAKKAGFELVASSEINANAKDTKDHPKGVWTLPPTLALGEQDREKYLEIGESDRMTLKFVKK
ncbi:class I SAM-dependent methyltransferase [Corallincola platygyrae]|uniref:Class I SAM-dependent methyltransferase n=1 Tax=Corallincola platygyrae TaxID=1193278 RepID=A0ABW4XUR7_9GAMM